MPEQNLIHDYRGIAALRNLADGFAPDHAATVRQLDAAIAGVGPASASQSFTASTVWVMDHVLPFRPNVTTVLTGGQEIMSDVDYVSPTRVQVTFATPRSGEIYLS